MNSFRHSLRKFRWPPKVLIMAEDNSTKSELKPFTDHQVVPDVIPGLPFNVLQVTFENQTAVNLGNQLTPLQASKEPETVTWPVVSSCKADNSTPDNSTQLFTLAMVDPDAPSRQNATKREVLHWLVVNIPKSANLTAGKTIMSYIGPKPPPKTGLHRYIFLAYKQNGEINVTTLTETPRYNFNITKFGLEHNLESPPYAGNFFLAQNPQQ